MEIWKPVVGYEGIYSVSNLGSVRRDKAACGAKVGRILKPEISKQTGYLYVNLSKNQHVKHSAIHQIVANAFIGIPPREKIVHHIDSNKMNCSHENLTYVTYRQNSRHASEKGLLFNRRCLRGMDHPKSKLKDFQVLQIRDMYKTGTFKQYQLAKIFNISQPVIGKVIRNELWKHI